MKLPRFNLRDLFWLVLVVAMGCGWWMESAGLRRQLREANGKLEEADKRMMRALISY